MAPGTGADVSDGKVIYTTKELLIRIDDRFDRLEKAYSEQPSRGEFDRLENRVGSLEEKEIATAAVALALKDNSNTQFTKRDKFIMGAIAVLALLAQLWTITGGAH